MTGEWEAVVRSWLIFLFSLTGIGGVFAVVTKFIRGAGGGLR